MASIQRAIKLHGKSLWIYPIQRMKNHVVHLAVNIYISLKKKLKEKRMCIHIDI